MTTRTRRPDLVEKRPDLTQAQSTQHRLGVHARLCADLPNFAGTIDPIVAVQTQGVWP